MECSAASGRLGGALGPGADCGRPGVDGVRPPLRREQAGARDHPGFYAADGLCALLDVE